MNTRGKWKFGEVRKCSHGLRLTAVLFLVLFSTIEVESLFSVVFRNGWYRTMVICFDISFVFNCTCLVQK